MAATWYDFLTLLVIFSYSIDSTLLAAPFYSHRLFFVWHITHFDKTIKSCQKKRYHTLVNYMQRTINANVCLCSSHPVTGDLILIAMDQKDRALKRICSLYPEAYILKPTVGVFNNHHLRQLTKPHLSIATWVMNFMCNISQVF